MLAGLDTVHARHVDVHEHEVGLVFTHQVKGGTAVLGLADHLHFGHVLDQTLDRFQEDALVVDKEQAVRWAVHRCQRCQCGP